MSFELQLDAIEVINILQNSPEFDFLFPLQPGVYVDIFHWKDGNRLSYKFTGKLIERIKSQDPGFGLEYWVVTDRAGVKRNCAVHPGDVSQVNKIWNP